MPNSYAASYLTHSFWSLSEGSSRLRHRASAGEAPNCGMTKCEKALVALVFIAVVGLWAGSYFYITKNYGAFQWGIIGDLFGAINALFSGLAFAGVVVALFLQRKDLKLQQQHLERSIAESTEQTKLMREELRLAQERHDAEMQRIKNEGEPGLVWEPGHGNAGEHSYPFTNRGGRFRITKLTKHPGIDLIMHPTIGSLINYGDKGWLKIVPRQETLAHLPALPSTPWWFALHCRDQFGEIWHKDYRVEKASEGPFEYRPAE